MWCDLSIDIQKRVASLAPFYRAVKRASANAEFVAIDEDRNVYAIGDIDLPGIKVRREIPAHPVVLVKKSGWKIKDITEPAVSGFNLAQRAVGGPNALSTTLVGGALGGLGGYGLGYLYDKTVPRTLKRLVGKNTRSMVGKDGRPIVDEMDDVIDEDGSNMAAVLGTLGAAGGSAFGLGRGYTAATQGHSILSPYPWTNADPQFQKASEATGGLFVPSIPVDAFNRAVWNSTSPNPFGTKDRFGDNEQPMYTPPFVAASMGGVVSAAGAARGSNYVSPWDVAQVVSHAGINAGLGGLAGSATGLLAGKVLGALAGLTPGAQQYLQQTGLWAGALTGLAKSIF